MRSYLLAAILVASVATSLISQAGGPRFDVVSVKPNNSPEPGGRNALERTTAGDAPPGLVTAVREQLGLRLQSGTAQMEHLVIDSVERPQPD